MTYEERETPGPSPPDPGLRRRALAVVGAFVVVDLCVIVLYFGARIGLAEGTRSALAVACALAAGGIVIFGMEPFRRAELREQLGREPVPLSAPLWLFIVVPLIPTVLAWHYLMGDSWRASLARAAGIISYLVVFVILARLQRRGVKPYWRPAGYGFVLTGATAGVVWALVARARPFEGILSGVIFCGMHYAYVRWATRGAAIRAAGGEAPPPTP